MKAKVVKSTGSWYRVLAEDGEYYDCRIKGQFRIRGIKTTNPVAVGDEVQFLLSESDQTGLITHIEQRRNYIIRKSTKLSKIFHIIAANIDQAILIVTLREPRTSTGFIDRYLVTTEAYHIPAMLVFNKIDLYKEKEILQLEKLSAIYSNVGYFCFHVSSVTGEGIEDVKEVLGNKVSLLTGHSGTGKSTLINKIEPTLNLKVGEISKVHQKGKHITTFAEMYSLSFGAYIIDTPGIKEFGLREFDRNEVAERFPEFRKYMHDCKFNNCTHVHEPGCEIKRALEKGLISKSRYNNYLQILKDDYFEEKKWELK